MKKERQSDHDRFFADNQPVRIPADNKKGYKTIYRYVGNWKKWEISARSRWKCLFVEVISTVLYLSCALMNTAVNTAKLAGGFGIVSVVPWLAELGGVVRFAASKEYVRELSWDEVDRSIRMGCLLRFLLLLLSGIAGIPEVLRQGRAQDWLALAGILTSGMISLGLRQWYSALPVNTYRNDNGKPGKQF